MIKVVLSQTMSEFEPTWRLPQEICLEVVVMVEVVVVDNACVSLTVSLCVFQQT